MKSSLSTAQIEGAYRLIRNPSVSPEAIAEAGFIATVRACEAHPRGACCTESPAGRSTRQALRTAGSPGNRGKPHAECDAKRRAGRQARMFISYSEVSIKHPDNSGQALPLMYVCCREHAEDGACWHLLTSEKVASVADARRIVSHYERRWLTEEYYKA